MILKKVKLLASMVAFEAQRFKTYPLEVFFGVLSRIGETALYITFWILVSRYAQSGTIDLRQIVSYYLIVNGMIPFFYQGFGIGGMTIKLIKSGELNQILIRPINPIVYPYAIRTGRNLINLSFGMAQIVVGMIIAGGIPSSSLPMFVPVLLNTFLINMAFNIIIGTTAFYTTEGLGIRNAFQLTAELLRGSLIPLFLMPANIATALQFTPFPASQYHLATVLQGSNMPSWGFVGIGSLWAISLMTLAVWFWHRGLRKYEAIGI